MIERNRRIYIGSDDTQEQVLADLLRLADNPREVQLDVGSRAVDVTEAVEERFLAERSEPDLDSVQEPTEPTDALTGVPGPDTEAAQAPRKRAPRRAPVAEETA
jgi:DNA-binding protein